MASSSDKNAQECVSAIGDGAPILNGYQLSPSYVSMLSSLQQIGFSHDKALCCHTDDTTIYQVTELDFYITLHLTGELCKSLDEFASEAREILEWDLKLDFPRHILLTQLKCNWHNVPKLHALLKSLSSPVLPTDFQLRLTPFIDTPNRHLGFQLTDSYNGLFINTLLDNMKCLFHEINHHRLHQPNRCTLPLASDFISEQLPVLQELFNSHFTPDILSQPCHLSLRLYAANPCVLSPETEVYEMATSFVGSCQDGTATPTDNGHPSQQSANLLTHQPGDHIVLLDSCTLEERQGCPLGVNLASGKKGIFNLAAGRRVSPCDTLALHLSRSIIDSESVVLKIGTKLEFITCADLEKNPRIDDDNFVICPLSRQVLTSDDGTAVAANIPRQLEKCPTSIHPSSDNHSKVWNTTELQPAKPVTLASNLGSLPGSGLLRYFRPSSWSNSSFTGQVSRNSRRLIVMRHAERVDLVFGRGWITQCFDKKGVYRRGNLNLPQWLPPRTNYIDYVLDSPLTQLGLFVSAETGRALADAGLEFTACYASPALRCVQTASELLRAMNRTDLPINIDTRLFEWLGWYTMSGSPDWMSIDALTSCGYNVKATPVIQATTSMRLDESVADYYQRSSLVVQQILDKHKDDKASTILIVAHGCSLDACTSKLVNSTTTLVGKPSSPSIEELHRRTAAVPYCSLIAACETSSRRVRWTIASQPPIGPGFTHGHNPPFDWRRALLGSRLFGLR